MNLLQKVEELTLYTLQQETELRHLRSEVTTLRAQSDRLAAVEAALHELLKNRPILASQH